MADKGLGGDRSPSLAAAGGRGREAPGEEEEEGSGARAAAGTLGPGQQLSARSWQALGSPGSELRPFSRLPPSPLSSLSSSSLRPPPSLDVGCRLWSGGTGRGRRRPPREEGLRGGQRPRGPRACAGGRGGRGREPPTPASGSAVGPRARTEGQGSRAALVAVRGPRAWGGAARSQALPVRPPGSVRCYFGLRASHGGWAPLSLSLPHLRYRVTPIGSLPSRQLEMTGCANSSDIRGQPEPGRRVQGTASSPP